MEHLLLIGQDLDNPALAHTAVAALHDGALKLTAKRHELRNTPIDLGQMVPGNVIDLSA